MNTTIAFESTTRPSGRRRIRTIIASWVKRERPALSREQLMQLREERLLAERLRDEARTSAYAARGL